MCEAVTVVGRVAGVFQQLLYVLGLRDLAKTFRDQLPFHDVPIKLYLRHKRREEQPPPVPGERADARRKRGTKEKRGKKVDLSRLKFQTDLTEEEMQRDKGRYESDLWKDL